MYDRRINSVNLSAWKDRLAAGKYDAPLAALYGAADELTPQLLQGGVDIALRLQCVRDELLTGAMLFSAVFLLNEPYTCAHHRLGRILYGVLVGAITMGFRYYGVYETGVCFALLAVNSISGWMDRTESRLYQLMHRPAAGKEGAE